MGRYHQEDDNYAGAGDEKKGSINTIWLDITREGKKEYNMTEEMAEHRSVWHDEHNGRPITT